MSMTPEQLQAWRWEREIDERNRPLTDEELDAMFPEGYKVFFPFVIFFFKYLQEVIGFVRINSILSFFGFPRFCPRQQATCLFAHQPASCQPPRHPLEA